MAYQATSKRAVLTWTHQTSQGHDTVLMSSSAGGAWSGSRTVDSQGNTPSLAVNGSQLVVATHHYDGTTCQCGTAVFTGTTSGMTAFKVMSGQAASPPMMAMSSGVITLVWYVYSTSSRPLRVATRSAGGTWSSVTLNLSPYAVYDAGSYGGRFRFFSSAATGQSVVVRSS
jgi:hypothetical protein